MQTAAKRMHNSQNPSLSELPRIPKNQTVHQQSKHLRDIMDSQVHSDSDAALLPIASVVRKRSLPSPSKPAPKRHCHPLPFTSLNPVVGKSSYGHVRGIRCLNAKSVYIE